MELNPQTQQSFQVAKVFQRAGVDAADSRAGHARPTVNSIDISTNGDRLVAAGTDDTLELYVRTCFGVSIGGGDAGVGGATFYFRRYLIKSTLN